ncbi:MAG: tetratricopeptide repeat protein [Rhizomicrobium sp.]
MSLQRILRYGAIALLASLAAPALAQAPKQPPEQKWVTPPDDVPKAQRIDRSRNIDFLFDALKVAPDDDSAKGVENRIWALWLNSGSDTADLLMARVKLAMEAKDFDLAIRLLNAIIEIRPTFMEAWNRRATLYFLKKDYSNALADLRNVLALEPRHFGALAGLGTIMEELGDDKEALEAFRKAQTIHPHLKGVDDQVKSLAEKVEGRDI